MFTTSAPAAGLVPIGGLFTLMLIFIAAEYAYARLSDHDHDHGDQDTRADGAPRAIASQHDWRETLASIGVHLGDIGSRLITSGLAAVPMFWLYQHRLIDIALTNPWNVLWLFLGVEFCYYWFHRASHRVRWLWATHAVHHSATHFNLSAAVRLGWTGQLTGAFAFFLPLAWIGFHPLGIGAMILAGLIYQFFLHTSLPLTLGPLEYVLNSPTHHRVHHASNERCLDRNYGSTLIIFDRLFGTFAKAPEGEALRFGLKGRERSLNPLWIALAEWVHLWRDVSATRGVGAKLKVLFGAP